MIYCYAYVYICLCDCVCISDRLLVCLNGCFDIKVKSFPNMFFNP